MRTSRGNSAIDLRRNYFCNVVISCVARIKSAAQKQEVKKAGQQVAGHTTAFTKNYSEDTFNSESFVSRSETPLFKNSSTFLAHSLPSLMAHTTRD